MNGTGCETDEQREPAFNSSAKEHDFERSAVVHAGVRKIRQAVFKPARREVCHDGCDGSSFLDFATKAIVNNLSDRLTSSPFPIECWNLVKRFFFRALIFQTTIRAMDVFDDKPI